MTFANPSALWLLLSLPLAFFFVFQELWATRSLMEKFKPVKGMGIQQATYLVRWFFSAAFWIIAYAAVIIALADPLWGEEYVEEDLAGLETVMVLDISRSMLTSDLVPTRLRRSKEILSGLLSDLEGERHALVLVKGEARLAVPLTRDRLALERSLTQAEPESIDTPGTRLDAGLLEAVRAFTQGSRAFRTIVLVTDGGEREGESQLYEAARLIGDMGISLVVVGVGTPEGGEVPGVDGEPLRSVQGDILRSTLAAQRLERAADLARGTYVGSEDASLYNRLASLLSSTANEQAERGFRIRSRRQAWVFILVAIFALGLSTLFRGLKWRWKA